MNGPTSPAVALPPRKPNRSTRTVCAPLRPAATAAPMPAGPPPTTSTSASATTGTSRSYFIISLLAALAHGPLRRRQWLRLGLQGLALLRRERVGADGLA